MWMKGLLWQMLAGTLGGYTRGFILNKLADKPYSINQLAEALNIDYVITIIFWYYFDSGVGSGMGSGIGTGLGSGVGSGIGSGTGIGLGLGGGC